MTPRAHRDFWRAFERLPAAVQRMAREKFALWRREPYHPALHFKCLRDDLWSVRVNQSYRALGLRDGDTVTWFWIGTHAEYDQLIR